MLTVFDKLALLILDIEHVITNFAEFHVVFSR
jgi:hypothetical protein